MFRNRRYLAVVSGHFVVDVLNSMGAVLLAVLAIPLGLSNAQIGLALTIYTLAGSLSQPLFGWLSDRVAGRELLLAGLGIVWMALFFGGVALSSTWNLLLPLFMLAALGSGLFHPIGTALAAATTPDRAASATAIFFFGGQMGLATGPILGGMLFDSAGSLGVIPLTLLALLPATVLIGLGLRGSMQIIHQANRTAKATTAQGGNTLSVARWLVIAFIVLVAVRSSIQATYMAFLPKLFADRGWEPTIYGLLAGTFMGAAAVGNVVTGDIADRFGMRAATFWPLLLSIPAGLICIIAPSLLWTFVMCAVAGALIGGQHSVLVVHAQRLLPAKQGFAAGLILGFTFAAGAIGTWLVGMAADVAGLTLMMQIVTVLGLPAALLALTLPGRPRAALPTTSTPGSKPAAQA